MRRFKDILYVAEAVGTSDPALARAVTLAQNNQATLTLVAVAEDLRAGIGMPAGGPFAAQLQAAAVREQSERLARLAAPYRERIEIRTKVLKGTPFLEIVREVLRSGRDLVIKRPEAIDWLDRLLGSDDMHLLRKCPCPVWLVKPEAPRAFRRILAAVDVDDAYPPRELGARRAMNHQIVEMAGSLALSEFAELHIVHTWWPTAEGTLRGAFMDTTPEQIAAYVEQVRQAHAAALNALLREVSDALGRDVMERMKPRTHLLKGWARQEIPALARRLGADLVVMGTVARTGIPGFIMGNTAEAVLNQIDCSVLAVKPPGFVTPVALEA